MPKPTDIFVEPIDPLDTEEFATSNPWRERLASTFRVYPLCQLATLIQDISAKPTTINTVRYLVDCNEKIWFAEEGGASAHIPAHYQMTGLAAPAARCIAAGNMAFSADFQHIVMMNNKSGDFCPSLESTKWALAILAANTACLTAQSIHLHDELTIEQFAIGSAPVGLHLLEKASVIAWIETLGDAIATSLRNQPLEIKELSYSTSIPTLAASPAFYSPAVDPEAHHPEHLNPTDGENSCINPP